jgi:hypothetical protein
MTIRYLIAIWLGVAVFFLAKWGLLPALTWCLHSPTASRNPAFWAMIGNVLPPLVSVLPGFCAGWFSGRRGILIGALTGLLGGASYAAVFAKDWFGWFWVIGPGLILTCGAGGAVAEVLRSGRYRTSVFQNRSEARVSHALTKRFLAPDYHLLNHVTLRLNDGTTQIDHVLVSRFGIFVIETKDYKGWIFAGSGDRYWTQVLYRVKFRFQNPIRQNYMHVCAIQELLEFLPADAIYSAVVFTGSAEFKTAVPDGVFTLPGLLAFVEGHAAEVMSINRVQFCVGRLETARLSITKTTDVEHVQRLRRRHGNNE